MEMFGDVDRKAFDVLRIDESAMKRERRRISVANDPSVGQAWRHVQDAEHATNWCLGGLTGPNRRGLLRARIVASGEGGLPQLHPHLRDDLIMLGGFRVTAVDENPAKEGEMAMDGALLGPVSAVTSFRCRSAPHMHACTVQSD